MRSGGLQIGGGPYMASFLAYADQILGAALTLTVALAVELAAPSMAIPSTT